MQAEAAITVLRSREEVQRLWESPEYRPKYIPNTGAAVTFKDAPGDRGTEIHVDLGKRSRLEKLTAIPQRAKCKDDLRRFKQLVETGEIPRSDATPEGESVERKLKQRPAQPLEDAELEEVALR